MLRRALVVGAGGSLGRSISQSFAALEGWEVYAVDLSPPPASSNVTPIPIELEFSMSETFAAVSSGLEERGVDSVDAIVCAAGGWAGGSAKDGAAMLDGAEQMLQVCQRPAAVTAALAGRFSGTFTITTLIGAAAALSPTPGMLGYGMAKAATHFLVQALTADKYHAIGVLPSVIDTPANRDGMPDADFTSWTPPDHIADAIVGFSTTKAPQPGAFLIPTTSKSETVWSEATIPEVQLSEFTLPGE